MLSSLLASSSSEGLRIWENDSKNNLESKASFLGTTGFSCLSWNHTNQVIAVGGKESNTISLIQTSNGQLLSTIPFALEQQQTQGGGINTLSFSGNSRYLASGQLNHVNLWDLKRRTLKVTFGEHKGKITALSLVPETDLIAGDSAGSIRIWDVKCSKCVAEMVLHSVGVSCLEMSSMGPSRIYSGYEDGVLALWDFASKTVVRTQQVHAGGALCSLAISPKNSRLVATAGATDGRVCLIDSNAPSAAEPSAQIDVGDKVTCISFHEESINCAVGTLSGNILIYDWRSVRRPLVQIEAAHGPISALSFQVVVLWYFYYRLDDICHKIINNK